MSFLLRSGLPSTRAPRAARVPALQMALALAVAAWAWAGASPAGSAAAAEPIGPVEPIKIGLFIPTRGERAEEGRAVQRGAEMAAAAIEAQGLLQGRPLRLVVGSADARWESATTELVRLIYAEDVWALLGAVDGRSAHLAEQVVARARGRVVLVTPWATDATLTQIRVPWFFRVVPDDRQQAAALVREIFEVRRLGHVAVLVEDGYDARMSSETFVKSAPPGAVTLFPAADGGGRPGPLVGRLRQSEVDGWVFFARPASAARWLRELREAGMDRPAFAPLVLAGGEFLELARSSAAGAVFVVPGGVQELVDGQFRRGFVGAYGDSPGPLALYAYDGLMVLAEAIRRANYDREAIRDSLVGIQLAGVTGPVEFDSSGNRRGGVELGCARGGRLLLVMACR